VGNWSNISNVGNLETNSVKSTNGGFTTRARAFYENLKISYTKFLGSLTGTFSSDLSGIGSRLTGTTETRTT
jgi:hypothetical protein